MRRLLCSLFCAGLLVTGSNAQAQRSFGAAFGIEAVGGSVGAAAGLGLGLLIVRPDRCGSDDIVCILERLSVSGVTTAAGSTVGVWIAGRRHDTQPSLVGAVIGSLAGVAAGVGMLKLLEESTTGDPDPVPAFIGFSVTTGVVTAAFSRLGAALRRE
jgi:hypothetical protein